MNFRYFAVEGKVLKVKTKLSQHVGVEYYIEVHGINDRLSTKPLAVWKYNISTCVKNIHAPYFLQVCEYNTVYMGDTRIHGMQGLLNFAIWNDNFGKPI